MTHNMGKTDRMLRAVLGVLFILALVMGWTAGWLGWLLAALGAVFLLTSMMGSCPLYTPFGFSSDRSDR